MKNYRIINFKKMRNSYTGFLTVIEGNREVPFNIKRIYYIYNVPKEIKRGFHAHKKLEQVLISINGNIKIKVDDGKEKKIIKLNNPNKGLYIGPSVWHEMYDFDRSAVLLVLASEYYNEGDYIRDYEEFIKYKEYQLFKTNNSVKIVKSILTDNEANKIEKYEDYYEI